jgi:hypothetical protein
MTFGLTPFGFWPLLMGGDAPNTGLKERKKVSVDRHPLISPASGISARWKKPLPM